MCPPAGSMGQLPPLFAVLYSTHAGLFHLSHLCKVKPLPASSRKAEEGCHESTCPLLITRKGSSNSENIISSKGAPVTLCGQFGLFYPITTFCLFFTPLSLVGCLGVFPLISLNLHTSLFPSGCRRACLTISHFVLHSQEK